MCGRTAKAAAKTQVSMWAKQVSTNKSWQYWVVSKWELASSLNAPHCYCNCRINICSV